MRVLQAGLDSSWLPWLRDEADVAVLSEHVHEIQVVFDGRLVTALKQHDVMELPTRRTPRDQGAIVPMVFILQPNPLAGPVRHISGGRRILAHPEKIGAIASRRGRPLSSALQTRSCTESA